MDDRDLRDARLRMKQAETRAGQLVGSARADAINWRARFVAVLAEIEGLSADLPRISQKVSAAAIGLTTAAEDLEQANGCAPAWDGADGMIGSQIPYALAGPPDGTSEVWERIGGLDQNFHLFPEGKRGNRLTQDVARIITRRSGGVLYQPGYSWLRRRR